jgi:hypothetical protein
MTDEGITRAQLDQFIESHRRLIEAERERMDLERERVAAEQKRALSEHRRAAAVEDLLLKVGELTDKVERLIQLITLLVESYPMSEAIRELTTEVRDKLSQSEDRQMLQLDLLHFVLPHVPDRNGRKAELTAQLDRALAQPRIESLAKQITSSKQTLNLLQEQAARHGVDVPVSVLTGIEETKKRIEQLERELNECCE